MKKILYYLKTVSLIALLCFAIGSCSKDSTKPASPTDETKDRGHEMPDKVQLIITDIGTGEKQERTANKTPKGVVYDIANPIQWKVGHEYRFEIVYFNNEIRMNHEFVTAEMAPIHQHFFQLFQGEYPKNKEGRSAMVAAMNQLVTYQYQDTDPENGVLGESGVSLRRRSWDTQNPTEVDPVGLKGVFTIKTTGLGTQSFDLRIRLAHFLVKNKLEPKTGRVRKYNVLHYSGSFVLDADMKVPVKIVQ